MTNAAVELGAASLFVQINKAAGAASPQHMCWAMQYHALTLLAC